MKAHEWFKAVIVNSRENGILIEGKRVEAVFRFWAKTLKQEMCDKKDFDLPLVTFLAPPLAYLGWALQEMPTENVIYLSPNLEFESLNKVTHTVAHEVAHVALGHNVDGAIGECDGIEYNKRPHEVAANRLAADWGFPEIGGGYFLHKVVRQYAEKGLGARTEKWMRIQLGLNDDKGRE
jgi:hypothetical protein